ncbi:DUF6283 family protein [Gordonia aichiensis]|uniref:DUF6283 family protein n=1 Tax=Gordonia aichiensis TaxID=36820 RepID=UPI003262F5EB
MSVRGPAPRPCQSCPYRRDVPAGVWDESEYAKLRRYDADTADQPTAAFQCHQYDAGDTESRLCAGWVGCHGGELLALRLAATTGVLAEVDIEATFDYQSTVPLFESGAAAADHGVSEAPGPHARALQEKVLRTRSDIVV